METINFTVWKSTRPSKFMALRVGKHNIAIGQLEGRKAIDLAVHLRETADEIDAAIKINEEDD